LVIAFAGAAPSAGGELFIEKRFEVDVTSDVVYGSATVGAPEPGSKELLLDIYQPVGDGLPKLRPALLAVHGGGFRDGHKALANFVALCRDLASRGYVCASINYRLQGDDPPTEGDDLQRRAIVAAIEDAGTALIWLHDNAGRYHIDRKRVAVGGGSAGAITSLFLVYLFGDDEYPVRAVLDMWGGLYDRVDQIEAGDPPMIIIHGTEDKTVPFQLAKDIERRTAEVGVHCELLVMEGAGHGIDLGTELDGIILYDRIAKFFLKHLDLGG
jgi:acetyl esterase/lipase